MMFEKDLKIASADAQFLKQFPETMSNNIFFIIYLKLLKVIFNKFL